MNVCVVYDCFYPLTIGGAERWYRNLAERLADDGHSVTYLTRKQWDDKPPAIDGLAIVAVSPSEALYGPDGKRKIGQAIRFGAGVFTYLMRNGRQFDVVHTASFPYFSVIAAAAARPFCRYRLVIDWHEVWSRDYWRGYSGSLVGTAGYLIQRFCVHVKHRPFCFSRLHRDRLLDEGIREEPTVLEGELAEVPAPPEHPVQGRNTVVFAGRHISEKRPVAAVRAINEVRRRGFDVQGLILGDGPERESVIETIEELGLADYVDVPGFVTREQVESSIAGAICLLHPSSREGYGLVVVEASALGTPVVLAAGEDNAATELVCEGANGIVASSSSPEDLADAIVAVAQAGQTMRASTSEWFASNERRLAMATSLDIVAGYYEADNARS